MKFYAGIGSRETPAIICSEMTRIATELRLKGFILRSGRAEGADTAFEFGAGVMKQIFVPWASFGIDRRLGPVRILTNNEKSICEKIAEEFHPAWKKLSNGAKLLHIRNVAQVLGPRADQPSEFVVCWTKDGKASGGTGQALRIAEARRIPIFNLHDGKRIDDLFRFMSEL